MATSGTRRAAENLDPVTATVKAGDAFDLAARLDAGSVDLVCTSPPYWGLRDYGGDHATDILERHLAAGHGLSDVPDYEHYRDAGGALGLESTPEWYVAHLVEIFERLRPALKPGGSVWVNVGDTYFARWSSIRANGRQGLADVGRARRRTPAGGYRHDKQLLLVPARFAIAMQEVGWILRNDLIWAKPHVAPRPETDRLRLSHEHFFHFVMRRRNGRPSYYYDRSKAEDGALDVTSVGAVATPGGHSARFPAALIDPRIRSSSPERGLVLDPFCGVGTTVARAVALGRSGLGFELSPEFARLATENVTNLAMRWP